MPRVCLNLARYEGVLNAQTCTHLPTEDSAAAQVTQNMALQKVQCYNDYTICFKCHLGTFGSVCINPSQINSMLILFQLQ